MPTWLNQEHTTWFPPKIRSLAADFWWVGGIMKGMLKVTTVFFVFALALLAIFHMLALNYSLYWRFGWLDIFMHCFGGFVVALGLFTIKDFFNQIPDRLQYFVPIISGVIVAALSWELFEILIGVPTVMPGYGVDTITDIIMGFIGGFIGFVIGHNLRRL